RVVSTTVCQPRPGRGPRCTCQSALLSLVLRPRPPAPPPFPYTTLFRSPRARRSRADPRHRRDGGRSFRGGSGMTAHHRDGVAGRSEEHTSELQSRFDLVCRLLLEKKKKTRASRSAHTPARC